MNYVKASDVQKHQRVVFDMGYGHPMDEICVVTAIKHTANFFGLPVIRFKVRRSCGEVVSVADHLPDDKVEIAGELL